MLHGKDINKILELKNGFTPKWVEPDFISSSLKSFTFSDLIKFFSELKVKGYSFEWVMTILLSMPFIATNSVNSMLSGCVSEASNRSGQRHVLPFKEQSVNMLADGTVAFRC